MSSTVNIRTANWQHRTLADTPVTDFFASVAPAYPIRSPGYTLGNGDERWCYHRDMFVFELNIASCLYS